MSTFILQWEVKALLSIEVEAKDFDEALAIAKARAQNRGFCKLFKLKNDKVEVCDYNIRLNMIYEQTDW